MPCVGQSAREASLFTGNILWDLKREAGLVHASIFNEPSCYHHFNMDHGAYWVPRFAVNCQGEWGLCVVCECKFVCVVCCVLCKLCLVCFLAAAIIDNQRAAM